MGMVPASQFAMKIEFIPYKVLDRYLALDIILLMLAVTTMVMMTQVIRSLFLPKPSPFLAQLTLLTLNFNGLYFALHHLASVILRSSLACAYPFSRYVS